MWGRREIGLRTRFMVAFSPSQCERAALFDAAGPATDVNRITYLKRVADGAFDYDASKKAAG